MLRVERQLRENPGAAAGERLDADAPLKTKAAYREVALTPPALAALAALRASRVATPLPSAPVFTMPRGGPLRQSNLGKRGWDRVRCAAEVDAGFHALRRTFATRANRAGVPSTSCSRT